MKLACYRLWRSKIMWFPLCRIFTHYFPRNSPSFQPMETYAVNNLPLFNSSSSLNQGRHTNTFGTLCLNGVFYALPTAFSNMAEMTFLVIGVQSKCKHLGLNINAEKISEEYFQRSNRPSNGDLMEFYQRF